MTPAHVPTRRELLQALLVMTGSSTLSAAFAKPFPRGYAEPEEPIASTALDAPPVGSAWPATAEGSVVSRDGTRIFFRSAGMGQLAVLLVHGWSCNHHFFAPQFAALAERYRVVGLDLAGHGLSGRRVTHSVAAFADDVQAVANAIDGPLVLVVHSAGGRVACAAVEGLGDRLLGIVGIDSFQNLAAPAPDPVQAKTALAALRADFSGRVAETMGFFFPPDSDPALRAWVQAQMSATDPMQAISAASAYAKFDAKSAIQGFTKPIIALNSDGVPTDERLIRRLVPHFSARIFAGQGHFLHLAHWNVFNKALLGALAEIQRFSAHS